MIPFDQLRSALLAADPHSALDRLVTTELAAGRKTKAIYDELIAHTDAVRAMPEYTDALEDPLGDTLDALCGWVHPDAAYRDAVDLAHPQTATSPTSPVPNAATHTPTN